MTVTGGTLRAVSDGLLTLVEAKNAGVLVTIKRDGRPQLSNIDYTLRDGVVRISVTDDRAKVKNLRRDPRASLYVVRDDFWSYAVVEGDAELSPVAATRATPPSRSSSSCTATSRASTPTGTSTAPPW